MSAVSVPRFSLRLIQLLAGLWVFGMGIALMLRAGVGLAPWDVLTQGIALQSSWPFGLITVLISLVILLMWWPLGQRAHWGTLLNCVLIGPAVQLGLAILPAQIHSLHWQIGSFMAGLVLIAVATGLYIGAHLGTGPRDGLMMGLHARTGWAIWQVRTALEVCVLAIGGLLGGNIGWGTLVFALSIGPLCGITLPLFDSYRMRTKMATCTSQG